MSKRKCLLSLILLVVLGLGSVFETRAQVGTCTSPLGESYLDINNVRARILNNGNLFWRGGPNVYNVPKGGRAQAMFNAGIWIGGFVDGQLRVAAARYNYYQFWAGPLDEYGAPPADCSDFDRLYKVSIDDIQDYEATGVITPDLRDWPTGLGAPTYAPPGNGVDDDGDGETDEPGETLFVLNQPLAQRVDRVIDLAGGERPVILGDQSIWWVMNDRGNEHNFASSPPIGLEVHATAFAFRTGGDIGNTTFYKYDFYYRGNWPFTDVYMAIFADPDLGNFQDDWLGSDTTLGVGYVWNADNDDESSWGYGSPPPALGFDFIQGPIVPSPGDSAKVSTEWIQDFKNLKMTSFLFYQGGACEFCEPSTALEHYNYMRGRWRDGKCITVGGPYGIDFSLKCTYFMFPGDPSASDDTCQYWSECNSDGTGTDTRPSDRRFVMGTGPFTIDPGDFQQIVYGLVWARGTDNFDSVKEMKKASAIAQAAYDNDFQFSAPAPPQVTVTAVDGGAILEWTNSPQSNNFLESYRAEDPFAREDNNVVEFEGYEVIQYSGALDQVGVTVAVYDVINGVTRVVDGIQLVVDGLIQEEQVVVANGTDRGVQNFHVASGLTNYTTYHFGVQAYAQNYDSPGRKISRGPVTRVSVTPTRSTLEIAPAAIAAAEDFSSADFVAHKDGIGDGFVTADIINPAGVKEGTYTVEFFEHEVPGKAFNTATVEEEGNVVDPISAVEAIQKVGDINASVITYSVKRDDTMLFDGRSIDYAAPQRDNVMVLDGLLFTIRGPSPGFKDFQVTANAGGPVDPPAYAAITWNNFPNAQGVGLNRARQQTNGSIWMTHAGGAAQPYASFVARSTRNGGNSEYIGIRDYEMRFTERCANGINGVLEPTDCLGFRAFSDGSLIEIPIELWDTGVATANDASDDVRLVPIICDTNTCGGGTEHGVFDIGSDHPASGAANDPFTDWVYWYPPADLTPGEVGHERFFAGEIGIGHEIIARLVLVGWNIGSAPPYDPDMPELGTVLRIVTSKPNQPGDVHTFTTEGYAATEFDLATKQLRLEDTGIVPNPYKGASSYEVGQFTDEVRFTNLPDVATIRVFTLNGTLIKTINKQSPGVATIPWNLTTDQNLPIASGMYLIHVEVPGVGSHTIKFGVVKKRIQLNVY
ncbi:MAG: T9SS type A sorting domain-containing protein [Rhodothermaceae bacterium]|nr:T9SS type A sorting domain-containing protein [Rhodothermaceae bacterium]